MVLSPQDGEEASGHMVEVLRQHLVGQVVVGAEVADLQEQVPRMAPPQGAPSLKLVLNLLESDELAVKSCDQIIDQSKVTIMSLNSIGV